MKVIDLLVRIANGEEVPNKVKYYDIIYRFDCSNKWSKTYVRDEIGLKLYLFEVCDDLNDEVEIIEDKGIEKLGIDFNTKMPNEEHKENCAFMMTCIQMLGMKVDEIIDRINRGK